MKKISISILGLFLISALALIPAAASAGGQTADPMKREDSTKAKKETAPKSDDEVQRCIADKVTNSEKLKSQGFNVTVSGGEVTYTGTARNAGSKGAMTRIAQSCGAKSVKNNITAPAIPRPKRSEPEKKS
jgi:osmotically-inducible protein OsmY